MFIEYWGNGVNLGKAHLPTDEHLTSEDWIEALSPALTSIQGIRSVSPRGNRQGETGLSVAFQPFEPTAITLAEIHGAIGQVASSAEVSD